MNLDAWARGALRRAPDRSDYIGCSYEEASRRATAICKAAADTGRTINASLYLSEFRQIMLVLNPACEAP
jgi:hypothetical protein